MIRVLVADDNPVVRQGLRALLGTAAGIEVVGEAKTGRQAVDLARDLEPDLVLLDVRMPVMDGVSAAGHLSPDTKVLMLTYSDEPATVADAIRAGASGYLVHGQFEARDLASAIRRTVRDEAVLSDAAIGAIVDVLRDGATDTSDDRPEHPLTPREAEVMDEIAQGLANAEIADELFISEKTVKNHINRIYRKLDVSSRAQAMARWLGTDER